MIMFRNSMVTKVWDKIKQQASVINTYINDKRVPILLLKEIFRTYFMFRKKMKKSNEMSQLCSY